MRSVLIVGETVGLPARVAVPSVLMVLASESELAYNVEEEFAAPADIVTSAAFISSGRLS